ncbi:MAG TPA: hypothetical protein VN924_03480 [Bryobacteraceae bacterium]|nr:hypothetical protein [Bryobacteraceae bacterium]
MLTTVGVWLWAGATKQMSQAAATPALLTVDIRLLHAFWQAGLPAGANFPGANRSVTFVRNMVLSFLFALDLLYWQNFRFSLFNSLGITG